MNRDESLRRLRERKTPWDLVVIGGGAHEGRLCPRCGGARARSRSPRAGDFGQGTSSRSTKLIHGGVRYLKQGRVALVREALLERERLRRNAAAFVRERGFVIPVRSAWEGFYWDWASCL